MIFDTIAQTSLPEATIYAIACKYLLAVCKSALWRASNVFWAPWVGSRLLCLGVRTNAHDLPEGMFSATEREVQRRWHEARRKTEEDRVSEDLLNTPCHSH